MSELKTYTGSIALREAKPRSKRLQGGVVNVRSASDVDLSGYLTKTVGDALYHPYGGALNLPFRAQNVSFDDTAVADASETADLEVILVDGVRTLHTRLPFCSDLSITGGGKGRGGDGSGGGASTLSGLNDVRLTSLSGGQMLIYNGSYWINSDAPSEGVQSDWDVDDKTSLAYIKNKPDLSVYALASELLNYVTIAKPQTISGQKTFSANVLPASINQTLGDASHFWGGIHFKANGSIYVGTTEVARLQSGLILSKALLPYTAGSDYLGTTDRPWLSLSLSRYIYLVRENNGTNESAVLFGRDSSQIYIGSVALSAWGLPMGIYAGEAMNFYVRASGASSPAHVMQLLADKIVARQNLQPLSSNEQDLGASSAIWRNLHAKRWYPNGAAGPYIEYDTSVGAFHIAGDLYADGAITAGGRAERDESGILALDALYDHLSASSWTLTSALSAILDGAATRIASGQITGISCSNGEVSKILNIAEVNVTDDGFITIYFGRSSRLESESGWTYYNSWN